MYRIGKITQYMYLPINLNRYSRPYLYYASSKQKKTLSFVANSIWDQREVMVLLENQAMPSLRNVAHDGVLCTFSNRSAPDRGKWCGPSGKAAWTVDHVQNLTLVGHSPSASLFQAGGRVGPAL